MLLGSDTIGRSITAAVGAFRMAVLTFGEFRLDTSNKQLWRGAQPVELSGIYFAVLCHLVERSTEASSEPGSGCLVTKRELRDLFWRDVQVSEETLRTCMSAIRKVLGDDPQQPRYIKTQNREGWRFMMTVTSPLPITTSPGRSPQPPGSGYDPSWYIERPNEERDILGCIEHPGRPVVVYGPQGCGKSSLINRALSSACAGKTGEPPCRVIRISMRSMSEEHLGSLDAMLQELGRRMLDPEEEAPEQAQATLSKFWAKPFDGMLKLKRLVRSQVLLPGQIVYLVLANAERLAPWRFQAALFDMFRAWQEADGMSGLRLIVETAIPPRLFSLGGHSPLWTKSQRIPVRDLDVAQIARMAELYGLRPSPATCAKLGELVGGLAMLCRVALFHAVVNQMTLDALMQEYRATPRSFGAFTAHLEDVQQWLEQQYTDPAKSTGKDVTVKLLKEAAQGISLNSEDAWPLVRKGLLTETDTRGAYRLRCRLYEDFFSMCVS